MKKNLPPPSPEAFCLQSFFNALSQKNCNYSVLRNYDSLPYHTGGSDIDMLVGINSWQKVHALLSETAIEAGGKCIAKLRAYRVLDLAFCGKKQGEWWGVRFDTFTYVGTNGCDILPSEAFLARSFSYNGVSVAHKGDAAVLSFLKEVIGAGQDPKNYQSEAKLALQKDHEF